MNDLYIARQPIFDKNLSLYGYELLYRANQDNLTDNTDSDQTTAHTIMLSIMDMGLDNLVGKHKAFINLSPEYLMGDIDLTFPNDRVILEVSENKMTELNFSQASQQINDSQFTIALDGIQTSSASLKLLPVAAIVKIDISQTPANELQTLIKKLKQHPVKLLAEKVEDANQVNELIEMGFDYLQGYFFSHPVMTGKSSLSTSQLAMTDLLTKVYDPDVDIETLQESINKDVTLSYHLLKYLNSAFFSLPTSVESIRQAIIYLGRNELRTWATVICMADNNTKPSELITTALARARFCDSLARSIGSPKLDSFFSAGLLSVLDALMDQPMPDIIKQLPLNEELSSALINHSGIIGAALNSCIQLEQAEWENIHFSGISDSTLNMHYLNAIQWSDDVCRNLSV